MDAAQAIHVAECLPAPPAQVAPSAGALLAAPYWAAVGSDLATISACLSGLEEHDAVASCRKLANEMVHAQREAIMGRMRRLVATRSAWMEGLDREREKHFLVAREESHAARQAQRQQQYEEKPEAPTLFPAPMTAAAPSSASASSTASAASAKQFCDWSLERLAKDSDQCVWSSRPILIAPSSASLSSSSPAEGQDGENGGAATRLVLQLKLTPSMADILELPETYELPHAASSSSCVPIVGILHRAGGWDEGNETNVHSAAASAASPPVAGKTVVFRAPPLKRSGTWAHPNPPPSALDGEKETYSSGTPDEEQMLYYLRLYLSLGGDRGNGQFLSHHLVREAALLLATQIALFELTQTPEAKFDLAGIPAPLLSYAAVPTTDVYVYDPSASASLPLFSPHVAPHLLPCVGGATNGVSGGGTIAKSFTSCTVLMPAEAVAGRAPMIGGVGGGVFTPPAGGLPRYDAAALQLHDAGTFGWALKYCYGEALRGVLPPHLLLAAGPTGAPAAGRSCFGCAAVGGGGSSFIFVPPSVVKYMAEYVK